MELTSRMKPDRRHAGWPKVRKHAGARLGGCVLIATAASLPAAGAAVAAAPLGYAVTILGTLSPDPNLSSISNGAGVNDLGWVVGDANVPVNSMSYPPNTTEHATLWRHGQVTDLGSLGGPNSSIGFVARPSDTGLISGNAQNDVVDPNGENWGVNFGCSANAPCEGQQYEDRGFVWRDGVTRPLPTLGGNNALAFGGVNDEGQMAGMAETAGGSGNCQPSQFPDPTINQTITLNQVLDWKPVVWGPVYGEVHQLPVWPGDTVGAATAINDMGQVVGGSGECTTPAFQSVEHALLWQDGQMINLGSLGGTYDNLATAINNRGQVVGWSDLPGDAWDPANLTLTGTTHSFLWQHGTMTDLGTLPGDQSTYAYGINNAGQVVGQSCDANANCQAFLWQKGTMTDLNTIAPTPGFDLVLAEGINAQGEIVGNAVDNSTGNFLAFSALPTYNPPASDAPVDYAGPDQVASATRHYVTAGNALRSAPSRVGFTALLGLR